MVMPLSKILKHSSICLVKSLKIFVSCKLPDPLEIWGISAGVTEGELLGCKHFYHTSAPVLRDFRNMGVGLWETEEKDHTP